MYHERAPQTMENLSLGQGPGLGQLMPLVPAHPFPGQENIPWASEKTWHYSLCGEKKKKKNIYIYMQFRPSGKQAPLRSQMVTGFPWEAQDLKGTESSDVNNLREQVNHLLKCSWQLLTH